jgi:hypothetical protein
LFGRVHDGSALPAIGAEGRFLRQRSDDSRTGTSPFSAAEPEVLDDRVRPSRRHDAPVMIRDVLTEVNSMTFVLVHSPLVGPITWNPVAAALGHRGIAAVVPDMANDPGGTPHWEWHARSVATGVRQIAPGRPIVLVGHSGAGALLPAIRQRAGRAVAAYVFVDAGLPMDGTPRLPPGPSRERMQAAYERGERFPAWTDADLKDAVPDPDVRRQLLGQIRPQPWSFWIEPVEVFAGWPDAPCAYLRFGKNPSYDEPAAESRRRGWPFAELPGDHFQMLVQPELVTDTLLALAGHALG